MDPLQAKANYSRVCHLLVDKGGDVLRRALHVHVIYPPSTLAAVLNANKRALSKIRYSVISPAQWELLFPATGSPDSNNFDITLLTILLRNICGLASPATGWDVMPAASDTSISANIARIKIFRNEVYGHVPSAQLDDTTFLKLWQEISKPLVNLGIPQHDIDELKNAPLTPEEESYAEKLKEWKNLEDDRFANLQEQFVQLRTVVENSYPSQTDRLAKFDFTGKIENLCEKFQHGTRQWFFDKLASWFRDEESSVMILTAGPGVGKSVLSAKVCEQYQQDGHLAAYHFCDFRTSDYADPLRILQSLASQMSDNVEGFRNKLAEVLCREHSRDSLSDAFRVLLNDPLHALERHEPMLIVVDALDESKTAIKSEFLDLVSTEFSQLPKWIKIFISSRPELQVRKKLEHLNPLEILPDDHQHKLDLKHFIQCRLRKVSSENDEYDIWSLMRNCQGSFLYAYYLVNELNQKHSEIKRNINDYIPKGISGFYEKQFERLKTGLQRYKQDTGVSIFKIFANVVAASREPLPFKILFTCMGLSGEEFELRQTIIGIMSEILPVYDDCLTVYHKSLWDWLTLNGYEEHTYAADVTDGNERLWRACKNVYRNIDSLSLVSDFQISREERYALKNGGKYLKNVGNQEDFHWLVNVNVNFLTLKFFQCLCADDFNIFRKYKAGLPDHLYWRFIQHYTFSEIIEFLFEKNENNCEDLCYIYLQYCAIRHVGFAENTITCKNTARDILDKENKIWLEEITNETNSTFKVISHAVSDFRYAAKTTSPDNKLLVRSRTKKVEVFEFPSLRVLFQLDVSEVSSRSECIAFCPDSSYFLRNSLQTCVSIKKQKELPFIPHGPGEILWCSFFSCGTKLVTAERESIKVWDVRKKEVLAENEFWERWGNEYFYFSSCNSYIFVYNDLEYPYGDITVFESTLLKRLEIKEVSADAYLTHNDCVYIIYPSPFDCDIDISIGISRHCQLPTGEIVLFANKYCSKPFMWKGRKCVICLLSPEGALSLLVCDFINQEVVDTFQISCLPSHHTINYISNLGEKNFLICFDDFAFVLSLESSSESFLPPFLDDAYEHFIYPALSPDSFYVALCYGHPILTIVNVDNGKTLQTVVPKQKPRACWWSELHLWVICDGLEVIRYPYVSTHPKVLVNDVEECSTDCKGSVLEFAEGVLVAKLKVSGKISISKICDEKLCPQQILDSNFNTSSGSPDVAISSDGCAVFLYNLQYELWEIGCEGRWELLSSGKFHGEILYVCLTGTQNSRSFLLVTDRYGDLQRYVSERNGLFSSIHFENDIRGSVLTVPDYHRVIYADCKILICLSGLKIVFIDVSNGEVITSIYAGLFDHYFFSAQKRVLLLFLGNIITSFKIHNMEKYLSF